MIRTLPLALLLLSLPRAAAAQPREESLYTPSIFVYGFDGFLLGAGAGIGAGYLVARADGWHSSDWQPLAYGAGIGALAGGTLGLSLGITDMVNETHGRGYFVLRDGGYGLGFGAATGAIAGGLAAVSSKRAENILLGAAVGGLIGTGVGVVLGIVEGQRAWRRTRLSFTLLPGRESSGDAVWMPGVTGTF